MTTAVATTGKANGNKVAAQPAPITPALPSKLTEEDIRQIKQTVAKDCKSDANFFMFLHDCERAGVHPLDRLIHYTERGGKYTPITSIDLLRSRAAPDHAGSDDPVYKGEPLTVHFTATVTVYRMVQGQRCPWTATARWAEYYPGDGPADMMWRKMPFLMLGKAAEALALRKAFPRQLRGLYTREEMDQVAASPPLVEVSPAQQLSGRQATQDLIAEAEASQPVEPPAPGEFVPVAGGLADEIACRLGGDWASPKDFCHHFRIEVLDDLPAHHGTEAVQKLRVIEEIETAAKGAGRSYTEVLTTAAANVSRSSTGVITSLFDFTLKELSRVRGGLQEALTRAAQGGAAK